MSSNYEESESTEYGSRANLREQENEISMTHPVRLISGHNRWEWYFLLLSSMNVIFNLTSACLAIHICALKPMSELPHFAVETLTCLVSGISLLFSIYGVIAEHKYDIYLHLAFSLIAIFLSWISFTFLTDCFYIEKMVFNIIVLSLWILSVFIAWKATHAIDWIEYKIIGVSNALTDLYRQLTFFLAVLKFDVIFMVIMSLFSAKHIFKFNMDSWLYYQGVVIVYAIVLWSMGKIAVKREDKCLALGCCILNITFAGFMIYQLFLAVSNVSRRNERNDVPILSSSIAFCILEFFWKIFTICWMQIAAKTFGNDLNSQSFQDLVARKSNSLLARSRSNLVF